MSYAFFASVEMIIWGFVFVFVFVWSVVMVNYFFNVKQSYIPVIALGYIFYSFRIFASAFKSDLSFSFMPCFSCISVS